MQRSRTLAARRRYTRTKMQTRMSDMEIDNLRVSYKEERKLLRKIICKSKADKWRKLCNDLEQDIWGDGYKIVMRTFKQNFPRVDLDREQQIELAGMLFPEAEPVDWGAVSEDEPPLESITPQEAADAADNLRSNRARARTGFCRKL